MAFYNIVNPDEADHLKSAWVAIKKNDSDPKFAETKLDSKTKYQKVWEKIVSKKRPLDAGKLEKALEMEGLIICHHEDHFIPNGVTTSTAGILIVFEDEIKPTDLTKIDKVMKKIEDDSIDDFFTPIPTSEN